MLKRTNVVLFLQFWQTNTAKSDNHLRQQRKHFYKIFIDVQEQLVNE